MGIEVPIVCQIILMRRSIESVPRDIQLLSGSRTVNESLGDLDTSSGPLVAEKVPMFAQAGEPNSHNFRWSHLAGTEVSMS